MLGTYGVAGAAILLGTMVAAAPLASKADDAASLVDKRIAVMKANGDSLGAVVKVVKGEAPMSPDIVKAAQAVQANAQRIPSLFPEGSVTAKSRAKPEIWARWDEFKQDAARLDSRAGKLAELAAAGDVAALRGQLKEIGDACNACHDTFRKPEEKK